MVSVDVKTLLAKSFIPRLLCGLLGLMVLLEIMFGLRTYFTIEPVAQSVKPQKKTVTNVSIAREDILKMPMFGDFLPEDLAGVAVKSSTLHFKLLGVIMSDDEKKSAVIIELQGGEQEIFHLGDTIPGGAVIKRINKDEMYVSRNGGVEYLFLPEKGINLDDRRDQEFHFQE